MAENKRPTGLAIMNAIRAERNSDRESDRSNLNDTLVKSALWKKNTLQEIDQSTQPIRTREVRPEGSSDSDAEQYVQSAENDDSAGQVERRQAETLRRRDDEIRRLHETIVELEAENDRLVAEHQEDLEAHKNEILEFQAAYDQFQEQSDQLMNELDEENGRLRLECKLNNKRSIL
jgi:DNA anti-recombination protein RmuC